MKFFFPWLSCNATNNKKCYIISIKQEKRIKPQHTLLSSMYHIFVIACTFRRLNNSSMFHLCGVVSKVIYAYVTMCKRHALPHMLNVVNKNCGNVCVVRIPSIKMGLSHHIYIIRETRYKSLSIIDS